MGEYVQDGARRHLTPDHVTETKDGLAIDTPYASTVRLHTTPVRVNCTGEECFISLVESGEDQPTRVTKRWVKQGEFRLSGDVGHGLLGFKEIPFWYCARASVWPAPGPRTTDPIADDFNCKSPEVPGDSEASAPSGHICVDTLHIIGADCP